MVNSTLHRDNVEPLIKQVSGALHKSFRTHNEVLTFYLDTKRKSKVCVVRNPGDDYIYGPALPSNDVGRVDF